LATKLSGDNQLDWTISLTSGSNKVGTDGKVKIDLSTKPAAASSSASSTTAPPVVNQAATSTYSDEDRAKHVNAIKAMLNECEEAKGKDNKAKVAIKILDYIAGEAIDFTNYHIRFKNTVINKCYEFKQTNADMPDVVAKADKTLIALGASTTIPADFKPNTCGICGGNHQTPVKPVEPAKPTEIKDNTADLALFTSLAKKYNHKYAMENPKAYLSYFESAVRWRSVTGKTRAEQMNNYFYNYSDIGQRDDLMKKIFTKHNLVFSDAVMPFYYDWVTTYKPEGHTNRYKKMTEFATKHKTLFTA
jgi:hypothetical protein